MNSLTKTNRTVEKYTCNNKYKSIHNPIALRTAKTLWRFGPKLLVAKKRITVIILNIGTDRSEQTVQTQIRLLLMEQSDQGLLCLLFCLHLLNTILHCKIQLFHL